MEQKHTPREIMEQAAEELGRKAEIAETNEGQNPMMPAETPIANDNEEYVIRTPQPTPDEVIEQEGLGAKEERPEPSGSPEFPSPDDVIERHDLGK